MSAVPQTQVLSFHNNDGPMMPAGEPTPGDMLRFAMQSNANIETLRELMAVKKEWDADQARKAYHEALAAFKANPPDIIRDKDNKQYGSKYVSLPNLLNTGGIALGEHGLSATFAIDQTKGVKVTCRLTHRLGHYEEVSMEGPLDNSGQKNPLQQVKSTVTYLRGATFEAITGLAARDPLADDDANSSHTGEPPFEIESWADAIKGASSLEELAKIKIDLKANQSMPERARRNITALYNVRFRSLSGKGE